MPDRGGESPSKQDQNKTPLVSSPSKLKIEMEANSSNVNATCQHGNPAHIPLLEKDDSPPPCYSNETNSSWADFSDEDDETYGFPKRGGRGFRVALESGDYGTVSRDSDNLYLDGLDSDNASVSDLSAKVCELEDSEVDTCDVDTLPPPKDYASVPSFV